MKQPEEDMFQELSLWILNLVLWTQLELDHSDNYSDQITLYSVNRERVITGPKVITLKVPNLSIQYSMLFVKKPSLVIVSRDSSLLIRWVVARDLVWDR